MADASPARWHLAHTNWFFETMVLVPLAAGYRPYDERFSMLFNSYYESLGPRHPRPQRGLLTRPSVAEVGAYRAAIDTALNIFIEQADDDTWAAAEPLLTLGLHHEPQHQELLLTDMLRLLSLNPLLPAYRTGRTAPRQVSMAPAAHSADANLLQQLHDTAWQSTGSSDDPYPGFHVPAGAVGEYNGKFMVGPVVLRGGSRAAPAGHSRATYRNFFPPATRWQFSGLRLAQDR